MGDINVKHYLKFKHMIRHLFKLIWNKKKQNLLLMSEILVSFLVIFAVFSLIVYDYQNYMKPMGFDYENRWVISYNNTLQTKSSDSLKLFYETIRQTLKAMPEIEDVTYTSQNYPFSNTTNTTGLNYKNVRLRRVNQFTVEDSYKNVLNMKVLEGRWFEKQDDVSKDRRIVINASLREKLFGREKAVGAVIGDEDQKSKLQVIGVVEDTKFKGDYTAMGDALFSRADTASFRWMGHLLVKVKTGASAAFEGRLYKVMAGAMKNANIEIAHLSETRRLRNRFFLIPLVVILIVAGFLIINVALGLFGVLWYNINKRRGEIGLRRAIGASGRSVSKQLVSEALILSTFSLIIGSFFAVQFPILNVGDIQASVYLLALLFSILFIYLLVLICSLYPGRQAAAIYPAVALHED
jgi:putative ABC transport system permease protein